MSPNVKACGLFLDYFTRSDGTVLFVQPPGVKMGADDVPNAGINLSGQTYLICDSGTDMSLANPKEHAQRECYRCHDGKPFRNGSNGR